MTKGYCGESRGERQPNSYDIYKLNLQYPHATGQTLGVKQPSCNHELKGLRTEGDRISESRTNGSRTSLTTNQVKDLPPRAVDQLLPVAGPVVELAATAVVVVVVVVEDELRFVPLWLPELVRL